MSVLIFQRSSEWESWEFDSEHDNESKALESIEHIRKSLEGDFYEYIVLDVISRVPKQEDTRSLEEIKRKSYSDSIERLKKMDWRPLTENETLYIEAVQDYLEGKREEPPQSGRLIL